MSRWLTLQEYSSKYKISISTLRRRIKGEEIKYNLESGRYFLQDSEENLGIKEKDVGSFKEFQGFYKKLLNQKEEDVIKLKNELEDVKQLVILLEKEKQELEELIKTSSVLSPQPSI